MKKILMTLLAALASTTVMAKDQTLLTEMDSWKMYTRPELFITEIGDEAAPFLDIGFGWMLNEKLSLGPVLAVCLNDIGDDKGDIDRADLYYWGVRGDYTLQSSKLYHLSASLLVASGSVKVDGDGTNGFMVFEPAINGAVNVWEDVEIGLSLAYRMTDNINAGGSDEGDIRGLHLGIFARFTEF